MDIAKVKSTLHMEDMGQAMYEMIARLFPICRSITGNGVRESLAIVREHVPLELHEIPSGTRIYDWSVPQEWNIRDAFVRDPSGIKVIDFQRSNLHVMSYSVPVRARMPLEALRPHLYSDPDHPNWVPNRRSYYKKDWGFCLSYADMQKLIPGDYEVCIDSSLEDGSLTYGECFLPGDVTDEVLISTHVCHPSLCNDNLSGIVVSAFLAQLLAAIPLHFSYRFLFIPQGIGSISWLASNEEVASRIRHGLVLSCLGDDGDFTYKTSRRGDADIDRACSHVLHESAKPARVLKFSPHGGDERQFCSPGFDLPIGVLMRSSYGNFPQYHTSADDLNFVQPKALSESFNVLIDIIAILENNRNYRNTCPRCEPYLAKRGISLSGDWPFGPSKEQPVLWLLNMADGSHSLLDIAVRSGLDFDSLCQAARMLRKYGLLTE
ncbi:DUF4910 domain-containing protein [Planctomyces sp. SH-PL62]|uniref:DUF4910 domain-containing protein n=1 Tax=Planctomyces sp. SH-PL62 TaxID=1636152 RepID=UPI00078E1D99|nr:DUF4910 domain-containing protein [Planctomyces sp. SH-PL62]AMV39208.1 hypothetical protein VT85_17355 [Planctomyces sp. SH-PL62]